MTSQDIPLPFSEQLYYFLKQYSKAISIGIMLLAALLYAGYRWQRHQQAQQSQLAAAYAEILPQLMVEKAQREQAEKKIAEFIEQHRETTYGALLALQWAKHWIDQQAYDRAAAQLTAVLQPSLDSDLQALIRLRLARLQCQLKQPTDALKTLEGIQQQQAWWLSAQALRGDILRQQQDFAGARAAYQQVLNKGSSPLQPLVKLWLNDIAAHQEKP